MLIELTLFNGIFYSSVRGCVCLCVGVCVCVWVCVSVCGCVSVCVCAYWINLFQRYFPNVLLNTVILTHVGMTAKSRANRKMEWSKNRAVHFFSRKNKQKARQQRDKEREGGRERERDRENNICCLLMRSSKRLFGRWMGERQLRSTLAAFSDDLKATASSKSLCKLSTPPTTKKKTGKKERKKSDKQNLGFQADGVTGSVTLRWYFCTEAPHTEPIFRVLRVLWLPLGKVR